MELKKTKCCANGSNGEHKRKYCSSSEKASIPVTEEYKKKVNQT